MNPTFFFENAAAKCRAWVKAHSQILLAGFVFGLLAFGFFFTNKLLNHDEIVAIFGKGSTFTSGRWGLRFLSFLFPDFSMPWIYGLLSIGIMSIAVCVLTDLFEIKNKLLAVLLTGAFIVFPSQTTVFCYMFTSTGYAVAILLAILSIHFLEKDSLWGALLAAGMLTFSLGIYQAFISFASTLMLILLIRRLIRGSDWKAVLLRGLWYLAFLALCVAGYALLTWISLKLKGLEFNGYAAGAVGAGLSIPQRLVMAYKEFFACLTSDAYGLMNTPLVRLSHWILGALATVGMISALMKKGHFMNKLLLMLCAGLLPLSVCCFFLVTPYAVHTIVLFGFVCLYVAAVVLMEEVKWSGLFRNITMTALAVIIVCNIYVANTVSLELKLLYENAYAFYNSVVTQVKQTEGYDADSKVALIGDATERVHEFPQFTYDEIVGVPGDLINAYSRREFVQFFLGFETPFATDEEIGEIVKTEEYASMPVYPYYGSVKEIGDYIVVKFSDPE